MAEPKTEYEKHRTSLAIGKGMKATGQILKFFPPVVNFAFLGLWLTATTPYQKIGNGFPLYRWGGYPMFAATPNSNAFIFPGTKPITDDDGNPVIIPAYDQSIQSPRGSEVSFNSLGLQGKIGFQYRYRISNGDNAMKHFYNLDADPEKLREPVRGKLIEIMSEMTSGDTKDLMEDINLLAQARHQLDNGINNIKRAIKPNTGYHDGFVEELEKRYGVDSVGIDISEIEYDAESAELIRTPLDAQVEAIATLTKAEASKNSMHFYNEGANEFVEGCGFDKNDPNNPQRRFEVGMKAFEFDNLQTMTESEKGNIYLLLDNRGQKKSIPFIPQPLSSPEADSPGPGPETPESETPSSQNGTSDLEAITSEADRTARRKFILGEE